MHFSIRPLGVGGDADVAQYAALHAAIDEALCGGHEARTPPPARSVARDTPQSVGSLPSRRRRPRFMATG